MDIFSILPEIAKQGPVIAILIVVVIWFLKREKQHEAEWRLTHEAERGRSRDMDKFIQEKLLGILERNTECLTKTTACLEANTDAITVLSRIIQERPCVNYKGKEWT